MAHAYPLSFTRTRMLVSLNDITIRTGEKRLFEHTTWQIDAGQHWAIYGPTGSGKTSLAKAISRSVALVQGQVLFFFDETNTGQGRPYLHPDEVLTFSVETHREFLRRYAGYHQARWQSFEGEDAPLVAELIEAQSPSPEDAPASPPRTRLVEMFGLAPLLRRRVHQLSHGESRKLFLSLLLLRSPRLLILDDPFTGLDQAARERLRAGIEHLLEQPSPAILLLTSRAGEIPEGITHFVIVQDGRIAARGDRSILAHTPIEHAPAEGQPVTALQEAPIPPAFLSMVERYAAALARDQSLTAEEVVRLEDVSVQYQGVQVLRNVNWMVRQGERWALVGGNGAGKSTLLSLILADNPQAYANEVFTFGKKRGAGTSIWEIKKNIGWVSPELQIFYEKTSLCQEVIRSGFFDSVGLYRRCSAEQAAVADGWMRALELDALAKLPVGSLSAGQQRLVLLARALVKHPPLLVLDEPCQGLDDAHRRQFLRMIDWLCAHTPVTLIYVSHYQDEIPASITHRLRLDHGRVAESGPA